MFNKTNNPKRFLLLILTLFIINSSLLIATVRYVSHEGSNTPPYLTWETAADSIMTAINISVFGDTIYVANGVYEEQVVMIPGLSLMGAGMDSCIVDTRELVTSSFHAVEVLDSCIFSGFGVIVSYNSDLGEGIVGSGNCLIALNKATYAVVGILDGSSANIYQNVCLNNRIGISVFNSNAIVRRNFVNMDYPGGFGIAIEAFNFNYTPMIDSNYIETIGSGINKGFGAKPTITNNIIKINGLSAVGISLSVSDSARVYNNLIISKIGVDGIYNSGTQYLQLYNNYITGDFRYDVLFLGSENWAKNNVAINVDGRIKKWGSGNLVYKYNNVWNSEVEYVDFTPDSTNLSVDPMVVNDDSTQGELDFHLQMYSHLIDAGDPTILDKDSTRSDIGLYGGSFGESYTYLDLAPRPPVNLTAEVNSSIITLRWNRNTEADFNHYNLYRDTVSNFTIDSAKLVASIEDTFYFHIIPQEVESLYFKVTAVDNQDNESNPSEEVSVILVSVKEEWQAVNNYILYQNYANPFNPSTKIGYKLKERGYVKLYVYDIKGELVEVLVNDFQDAGYYEVEFHAGTAGGSGLQPDLASGVYIYQIHVMSEKNIPVFTDIKKMIYLK